MDNANGSNPDQSPPSSPFTQLVAIMVTPFTALFTAFIELPPVAAFLASFNEAPPPAGENPRPDRVGTFKPLSWAWTSLYCIVSCGLLVAGLVVGVVNLAKHATEIRLWRFMFVCLVGVLYISTMVVVLIATCRHKDIVRPSPTKKWVVDMVLSFMSISLYDEAPYISVPFIIGYFSVYPTANILFSRVEMFDVIDILTTILVNVVVIVERKTHIPYLFGIVHLFLKLTRHVTNYINKKRDASMRRAAAAGGGGGGGGGGEHA